MESTNTLRIVNEHGWRMGFANLFQVASGSFWRTKKWLIQIGIWLLCLNGMLASFLWQIPADMLSRAAASLGNIKTMAAAEDNPIAFAVMMFLMVCSMALPIAAIVAGQEAIIGERQSGTAAWLLSKPVSRPAFILSRLAVSAVGMLVTAVVIPGAVAYGMLSLRIGAPWPIAGFLAAMGMSFLNLFFYLTLTYMLGSIFTSRGPVLGISLAMALAGPGFLRTLPILKDFTPWTFFLNISADVPVGLALALGHPPVTVIPIICTALSCLIFVAVTILRFQREEF